MCSGFDYKDRYLTWWKDKGIYIYMGVFLELDLN